MSQNKITEETPHRMTISIKDTLHKRLQAQFTVSHFITFSAFIAHLLDMALTELERHDDV